MRFNLAQSIWPRYGFDRQNSSSIKHKGPTKGNVVKQFDLPHLFCELLTGRNRNGCVVAEDGTIRVSNNGCFSAWSLSGELLWQNEFAQPSDVYSLPIMFQNGTLCFLTDSDIYFLDKDGNLNKKILNTDQSIGFNRFERHGFSPNLTYDGRLLLGTVDDGILSLSNNNLEKMGRTFGYDVLPPAVYADNTFAVADNAAGHGLWRVSLSGEIIWKSQIEGFSGLVTLNQQGHAAVSTFNNSTFFDGQGNVLGVYPQECSFSVYLNGWIAVSKNLITRLDSMGATIWEHKIQMPYENKALNQSLVSASGLIYAVDDQYLICLDQNGNLIFRCRVARHSVPRIAPIQEGLFCAISDNRMLWIE